MTTATKPKHDGDCPATLGLSCKLCELAERHLGYRRLLAPRRPAKDGPGTVLARMLHALGFSTCGKCAEMASNMDVWGPAACRTTYRDVILARLRDQERQLGVLAKAKAGALAAVSKAVNGVLSGVKLTPDGLLDAACRVASREERYIAHGMGAAGLGDAILGTCAVRGYCDEHPDEDVSYGTAQHTTAFVSLFDVGASLSPNKRPNKRVGDLQFGHDVNGQIDQRCWQSAEWTRLGAYCEPLGVRLPRMPRLVDAGIADLCREYSGAWLLAPCVSRGDQYGNRQWPQHSWLSLAKKLSADGKRVLVVDNTERRMTMFRGEGVEIAFDWTAERLASLMLNAAVLIGNDSGPAHLNAVLGRPTVVLCGATRGGQIFGFYPHVEVVQGKLDCDGCWWQRPYRPDLCNPACPSLAQITVDDAVSAAERIIKLASASLRLVTWYSGVYAKLHKLTWHTKRRWAEDHGHASHCHRFSPGFDGWRQIAWWQDQLSAIKDGGWLWSLGADAAITGKGTPPTPDDADVVVSCDANGINTDSILFRNVPAVREMLGRLPDYRLTCRDEQQAMACALSGLIWRHVCSNAGLVPMTGGLAISDDLRMRMRTVLNGSGKVRVYVASQREMNAYPALVYGLPDSPEHWKAGDLVCHVPGVPLSVREQFLQSAIEH